MSDREPPIHSDDPISARRFREEIQRENRADFREQQKALRDCNDRLTALETLLKLHVQEMEQWRKLNSGAFEAASRLDRATTGMRMMINAVFILSTCILAVAGVLQLSRVAWQRFIQ
jgi:hypothetical protein